MSLLEDLTSGDAHRIWSSACAIRRLRDPEELALLVDNLESIKASTQGVALGGALRANASHLSFAIRKLEHVRSTRDCLCLLYTMDDLYNPAKEAADAFVRILRTVHLAGGWVDYYECECAVCGAKYRVEEREYHYTWWAWRRVS
jgi:hypothetical protein